MSYNLESIGATCTQKSDKTVRLKVLLYPFLKVNIESGDINCPMGSLKSLDFIHVILSQSQICRCNTHPEVRLDCQFGRSKYKALKPKKKRNGRRKVLAGRLVLRGWEVTCVS